MLILNENTTNVVILSLSELVTINNPTYLFRFVHKETKNEYLCICASVEDYTFGRQGFEIVTVNGTPNPLAGEVKLIYGDEYDYYIYAQTSTTNTDYTLADEQIQQGIARFDKTTQARTTYNGTTITRKSYTG